MTNLQLELPLIDMIAGLSPRYFGTLPFSFMAWLSYSVYLSAKIAVIFSSNIPTFMIASKQDSSNCTSVDMGSDMNPHDMPPDDPIHKLGTNLLKVSVGLSALVFIIMLQAHHNHQVWSITQFSAFCFSATFSVPVCL